MIGSGIGLSRAFWITTNAVLKTPLSKRTMPNFGCWDMVHQVVHVWGDDYGLRIPRTGARHIHYLFSPPLCLQEKTNFFSYMMMMKTLLK